MRRAKTLRALSAAVLAVSLAGCMKIDMQLELNSDDTVDGSMIFALSKDVAQMAESMGEDPNALFDEMNTADLPEGTETESYEDDQFVGQRYVFDGADLSEFSEDEGGFGITHQGDEFVVTGEMDMSQLGEMGDMQGLEEQLGGDMGDLGDLEGMMESFEMRLSITFPGEVIEHNGELDGTTVTWTPVPGENLEIDARAQDSGAGGDGIPVWLWILIAVVVIGLIGLLFFMSRGRSQGEPGTAGATEPGTAPPPPAGFGRPSTAETQMSAAEGAAAQVTPPGTAQPPQGTPLGADESVTGAVGEPTAPAGPVGEPAEPTADVGEPGEPSGLGAPQVPGKPAGPAEPLGPTEQPAPAEPSGPAEPAEPAAPAPPVPPAQDEDEDSR